MTGAYDDPGWTLVLKEIGPVVLRPWLWLSRRQQQRLKAMRSPSLIAVRTIFVGLFVAPFFLLYVMSSIVTKGGRWASPGGWGWAAAGAGVIGLTGVALRRHRHLKAINADALVVSWRSALFIGIGRAELPLYVALVLTLVSGRLWVFVVGLIFTTLGLLLAAPSRWNIEHRQGQLDDEGSSLTLGRLLTEPPLPRDT